LYRLRSNGRVDRWTPAQELFTIIVPGFRRPRAPCGPVREPS
jgi:hypothetical protein